MEFVREKAGPHGESLGTTRLYVDDEDDAYLNLEREAAAALARDGALAHHTGGSSTTS